MALGTFRLGSAPVAGGVESVVSVSASPLTLAVALTSATDSVTPSATHAPPCKGSVPSSGPCYQHRKASDKHVQSWIQSTKVVGYGYPSPGPNIAPYTRITSEPPPCSDPLGMACPTPVYCITTDATTPPGAPHCDFWVPNWSCGGPAPPIPPFTDPVLAPIDGGVACPAPDSTHRTVDANCFIENSGTVVDMSLCRKYGFKNVQAFRTWHGQFGYASHDNLGAVDVSRREWVGTSILTGPSMGGSTVAECAAATIEYEQPDNPDQVKYLSSAQRVTYRSSSTGPTPDVPQAAVLFRSSFVDPITGRTTRRCTDAYSSQGAAYNARNFLNNVDYNPSLPLNPEDPHMNHFGWTKRVVVDLLEWDLQQISNINGDIGPTYDLFTFDQGPGQGFTAWYTGTSKVYQTGVCDPATGYYRRDTYTEFNTSDGRVVPRHSFDEVHIDDTSFSHRSYGEGGFTNNLSSADYVVTGSLGTPNTAASVLTDIDFLLSHWKLDDDLTYPWRTDSFVGVAPLIYRNEVGTAVRPSLGECFGGWLADWAAYIAHTDPWTDGNGTCYDGRIVGAPLDIPGVDRGYFDFLHRTHWATCDQLLTVMYDWANGPGTSHGYGAYAGETNDDDATDDHIPKTATRWTENFSTPGAFLGSLPCFGFVPFGIYPPLGGIPDGPNSGGNPTSMPTSMGAGEVPAGAWTIFRNGQVWRQKWAEIKIHRPSINFARPCGEDRYHMDESTVRCVQDGSGTNSMAIAGSTNINTGDLVYVVGVTGVNEGVYKATLNSPTNYSIAAQPMSPSFVYSGDSEAKSAAPTANGVMGKLRWKNSEAPGICGRVAIYSSSGSNPTTLNSESHFLQTGDHVDVFDANGAYVVSNQQVTVFNGSTVSIPYGGGGGRFMQTHGAPSYTWNDDTSKGNFVYAEWVHNFRDYQERDRVIAQWIATGKCGEATPAAFNLIRPYQSEHGMPRTVSSFSAVQECLPFNKCAPQVMALSNNGEKFTNGIVHKIPSIKLDERYGSMYQSAFVQHVVDPVYAAESYFLEPHAPCVTCTDGAGHFAQFPTGFDATEDSGVCSPPDLTDDPCIAHSGKWYYPQRPWVEAITQLPPGAPTPPSGVFVGFLRLLDLAHPTAPDGNVLSPPTGTGYQDVTNDPIPIVPREASTPWGISHREWLCTCFSTPGRFAKEYLKNGITIACH
jgi:hypothetical protein